MDKADQVNLNKIPRENINHKNNSSNDSFIGKVLFHKYTLMKKLGEGSFGHIYSAKENSTNCWYAIKLENKNRSQNLLESEAYIMSYLASPRIPMVKSFGYTGDYNVLIMELMGKSLEDLFESMPTKKMSIRCVCNLGYQMVEILEFIHSKHIIHRDIKPDNFVMGKGIKSKNLYLLDFGLAKKYRSSSTLKHYPLLKKKHLTGTARYASINALNGYTQSRRDDLEAVGYVLVYFLLGRLPWQGMLNRNKDERYMKIMEIKRDTDPNVLCKGLPSEFEKYISYTRSLEYEQDPDYNMLKQLFLKVLSDEGFCFDHYYDWDSDVGTMTTCDTNLNFGGKINFKNAEANKQINQINEEVNNNINNINNINIINNNINEEKENDQKSMENILNNNNKMDDIKKKIMESRVVFEKRENEDEKEKNKEELKQTKGNNNKEENKNNNLNKSYEYYYSGIIKGEKRKNKKSEHLQCCIIV